MFNMLRFILPWVAAAILAGCKPVEPPPAPVAQWPAAPATRAAATAPAAPFIVHIPGVGGPSWLDRAYFDELTQAMDAGESAIYDWTTATHRGMVALTAMERNRQIAEGIAQLITRHFRADPNRPILITAMSGGAAIAVWMLEQLPPEVQVDAVLLLAPALSPEYDLSRALRHVRRGVFAFFSDRDKHILGWGTRMFGTMDRVRTVAAGCIGFVRPPDADPTLYSKVLLFPYRPDWWDRYQNPGTHEGAFALRFTRDYLAPLLRGQSPALAGDALPVPTTRPIEEP